MTEISVFDKDENKARMRQAVKDIINGCGESCSGCPIVFICEKVFRSEPWTWGTRCVQGQRTS